MFNKKLTKKLACIGLSAVVVLSGTYVTPESNTMEVVKAATVADVVGTKETFTDANGVKWTGVVSNEKIYNLYLNIPQAIKPDIVIPETIGGYTVAGIGTNCFTHASTDIVYPEGRDTFTVTLPPTIEQISDSAFCGISKLTEISFSSEPTQKVRIGNMAFSNSGVSEEFVEYVINRPEIFLLTGTSIFSNCDNLKELEFECNSQDLELKIDTFNRCTKLQTVKFIGESNSISLWDGCFQDCLYLSSVEFGENQRITIGAECFDNTSIESLDLNSKLSVNLYNGSLVGMKDLQKLNVKSGAISLYGEPFYGKQFAFGDKIYNTKLETIFFDVGYISLFSNNCNAGATGFYGSADHEWQGYFTGLKGLKTVYVGKDCHKTSFPAYSNHEYGSNDLSYVYYSDSFAASFGKKTSNEFTIEPVYLFGIDESMSLSDMSANGVKVRYLYSDLTVGYNNADVIETKEIDPENIQVTVYNNYKNDWEDIEYIDNAELYGYSYSHGKFNLGNNDSMSSTYKIEFANMSANINVNIIKRKVESFNVVYNGKQKIEGESLQAEDFDIENITYNDGEPETVSASAITVSSSALVAGDNEVLVTYGDKTVSYMYTAAKKSITSLDAKYIRTGELFSGDGVFKNDFKVTCYYNNNTKEEGYKDFEIVNPIVDETGLVVIRVGEYSKNLILDVTKLQGKSLDVLYSGPSCIDEGTEIDKNNLKVTLFLNNNTSKTLEKDEYSLDSYEIVDGENIIYVTSVEYPDAEKGKFSVFGQKKEVPEVTEDSKVTESPSVTKEPTETEDVKVTEEPEETEGVKVTEEPKNDDANKTEDSKITESPSVTGNPKDETNTSDTNTGDKSTVSPSTAPTATPSGAPAVSPGTSQNTSTTPGVASTATPGTVSDTLGTGSVKLELNTTSVVLGVKDKFVLKATNGKLAKLSSADNSIAIVNSNGKVTGKKVGTTKITAIDEAGNTVVVNVTVMKAPKKVKANKKKFTIKVGKSVTIKAKFITGQYGSVKFKSSNKSVAKVLSSGKIVGKKKGKCIITIKTYNGKKCKVKVTVK